MSDHDPVCGSPHANYGVLPRVSQVGEWFRVVGAEETVPDVPPADWKDTISLRPYVWDDVNQGKYPACCLAMIANAMELFMAVNGRELIKLDWYKAWVELSGGRGGVAIDVACRYITAKGMPIVGSTARIKVVEWFDAPDGQALISGIQRGLIGGFGHYVPGAHAECCGGWKSGKADVLNSWGRKNYGEDGWALWSLANIDQGVRVFGGFLFREIELSLPDGTFIDAQG